MSKKGADYKVRANDFEFLFSKAEVEASDMIQIAPGVFNIIKNGRSVNVQISTTDETLKRMKVEVEGQIFEVEIREELDQLLDEMGFGAASHTQIKDIKAPMPGLVLDILITEGQEVKAGEPLLILQAMKMENSITVHAPATIKTIAVVKGQAVDKGQLLLQLN